MEFQEIINQISKDMVVIFSIISTLGMTAFSYLWGYVSGNQFREPELLNQLVATSSIPVNPHKKGLTGWLIHLVLGFFWPNFNPGL